MRVVAGTARGLRLVAPPGREVRPTTDRVREATFNALGSLGAIEGARVLDAFAGSGALGIEALSRGAERCTFTDASRAAVEAVNENLATTRFGGRATVLRRDVFDHLRSPAARSAAYDIVLADPPYDFDGWAELLDALPAPMAVLESGRELQIDGDWSVVRQRTYGTTVVTIVERPGRSGGSDHSSEGE